MSMLYQGLKPTAYKKESITALTPDELDQYGDNEYFGDLIPFQYETIEYTTGNTKRLPQGFTTLEIKLIMKTYGYQTNDRYLNFKKQDIIKIEDKEYTVIEVRESIDEKKLPFITMNPRMKQRFTLKTLYLT